MGPPIRGVFCDNRVGVPVWRLEAEDDPVFDQTPVKVACPHCRPLVFRGFCEHFVAGFFLVMENSWFFWVMNSWTSFFFGGGITKPLWVFFLGCFFFCYAFFFEVKKGDLKLKWFWGSSSWVSDWVIIGGIELDDKMYGNFDWCPLQFNCLDGPKDHIGTSTQGLPIHSSHNLRCSDHYVHWARE